MIIDDGEIGPDQLGGPGCCTPLSPPVLGLSTRCEPELFRDSRTHAYLGLALGSRGRLRTEPEDDQNYETRRKGPPIEHLLPPSHYFLSKIYNVFRNVKSMIIEEAISQTMVCEAVGRGSRAQIRWGIACGDGTISP